MDNKATHIKTEKDFKDVWTILNNVFQIDQRMPSQVFKHPFKGFVFEEFDWAITPEFWDFVIKQLSYISQDNEVIVAMLDPDPINYFHRKFGYYSMVKFSINATTGDAYWDVLESSPKDSPVDAMLFSSDIMVWVPSSAKWAIWGERSYGACVLAFADENTKQAAKPLLQGDQSAPTSRLIQAWHTAQEASDNFISLNFKDQKTPPEFERALVQNYST